MRTTLALLYRVLERRPHPVRVGLPPCDLLRTSDRMAPWTVFGLHARYRRFPFGIDWLLERFRRANDLCAFNDVRLERAADRNHGNRGEAFPYLAYQRKSILTRQVEVNHQQ